MSLFKETIYSKVNPSEEEWEAFLKCWKPFHFPKNQIITDFDDVESYFYFVEDGVIRVYFIKDGEDYSLGFSYRGDFSGVYDSFVHQAPSRFAMESLTEVRGLKIHFDDLQNIYNEFKVFERWGRMFNEMILVGLGVFIKSIIADSAEERFKRLMNQSPHIVQLIPQKHLASYLGMTPETFSRMRKKWME